MYNVTNTTRASNEGKDITCPNCNQASTVYHFSWSALTCHLCEISYAKTDWLIKGKKPNVKNLRTTMYVRETFQKFVDGDLEKFDAYGLVFDQLDKRRITLTEICDIANSVGLARGVIRMRRHQFLGMK